MTNRGKSSSHRQANKSQSDDDNCSIICYKDSHDGHVGVVRIRQQPICSACNLQRGTLSTYYKHIVDNTHRENVKKLCDENRFKPSVYDQAIHLAFQNNFYYQSEKFHFLYKHTNEEVPENDKMEINNTNQQKTTPRKRRNFQVTLVFQDKNYSQIGIANAQIREQLLKDMITDRADDLAALPMEIYYTKKKVAPDDIHRNGQKSSVIMTTTKDQSQVMLKKQQQEPFENGQMSSAKNSGKDNGVEQNTAMTTHEISTAEIIDHNEQSSIVDDIVSKSVINNIVRDIYMKSDEFRREERFLCGLARRSFKKKNTFYCDICNKWIILERNCSLHLNSSEHAEKVRHYQTEFLPWRRAMQESLIFGKSLKQIMDKPTYDKYKTTMALYLAPNSLSNRGRFCCAYCEVILTHQWALEEHLHSIEHKEKKTSIDHKELVVRFANSVNFPIIFKFNGITQLSEIPDDIKTRYQWRNITRAQLDEDTSSFIRNYPYDAYEGVTKILSGRAARKQRSLLEKTTVQSSKNNNQHGRKSDFDYTHGGLFQTAPTHRGPVNKRPFSATIPPNKRFRTDLNNSFPGANRDPGSMRHYDVEKPIYNPPAAFNNGNSQRANRYPNDRQQQQQQQQRQQQQQQQQRQPQQQQQQFFERSNFESRSHASDDNGYYGGRQSYPMSGGNNYNQNRQGHFNGNGGRGYNNQQPNYDSNFIHPNAQTGTNYRSEQNSSLLGGPPNHSHHRPNTGPINELMHQIPNNIPHPQQQQQQQRTPMPPMGPIHHQNQNLFGAFGVNNSNNTNSAFFSSPVNQQSNQMGTNNPSIHSYADYRSSSGLPNNTTHSSMYSPLTNIPNPVVPQTRTFDEFGPGPLANNSSNPYARSTGPPFRNEEPRYGNFGHQNQMQSTSWRGSSRGGNHVRDRGSGAANSFQSTKQPGATFSYRSNSNNNNYKNNGFSNRGRGAGWNTRNYGSGY